MSHLLAFPAFSLSHTRWQGCLASYLAALTRYHAIMDAWWFVSTDLAGNYFDLSCGERKERRYCQDFSLSPVTAQHLLHGCMLRHETAPSFKRITSLPPSAAACLEEAILTLNTKPSKSTENVMSAHDLQTNAIKIKHHCSLQRLWAALSGQTQLFTTWLDLSTTGISVQSCLFNLKTANTKYSFTTMRHRVQEA